MQFMTKVFPVLFGVFSLRFASGLVVYWVTSNLWRIGQQHLVLNKIYDEANNAPPFKPRDDDGGDEEPPAKKPPGSGGSKPSGGTPKGSGPKGSVGFVERWCRQAGGPTAGLDPITPPKRGNGAGSGAGASPAAAGNRRKKRKR